MVKGFYYRLAIVSLFVLSSCILIGVVAMLPSYFVAYTKENLAKSKLEMQKKEPVPLPDQETLTMVKELNKKIALVERAESEKFSVSDKIIDAIISEKTSVIKITGISYQNDPAKGRTVSIEGNAPSRESLLSFRLALEKSEFFKQVDLPISNFVKGSDIQFYLSLIPS